MVRTTSHPAGSSIKADARWLPTQPTHTPPEAAAQAAPQGRAASCTTCTARRAHQAVRAEHQARALRGRPGQESARLAWQRGEAVVHDLIVGELGVLRHGALPAGPDSLAHVRRVLHAGVAALLLGRRVERWLARATVVVLGLAHRVLFVYLKGAEPGGKPTTSERGRGGRGAVRGLWSGAVGARPHDGDVEGQGCGRWHSGDEMTPLLQAVTVDISYT